ncbi:MAG: YncE family protein [Anaerolineae bacterium]
MMHLVRGKRWGGAFLAIMLAITLVELAACRAGIPTSPTPMLTDTATLPAPSPTFIPSPFPTATAAPLPTTPVPAPSASPTPASGITLLEEVRLSDQPALGREPAALSWMNGKLYVLCRQDAVLLIAENGRVRAGIPLQGYPVALAGVPSQGRLYAAGESPDQLYLIENDALQKTWPLPAPPTALLADNDKLYIGYSGLSRVDVWEMPAGTLLHSLQAPEGFYAYSLALDSARGRLFAVGFQRVLGFDLQSGEIVTDQYANSYQTLAVDERRGRWYVNDYDAETNTSWITAFDADSGVMLGKTAVGQDPRQALVHPTSGRLYVASSWEGSVAEIDAATLQTTRTFPVGSGTTALALDDTGRRLFAANRADHNVVAIDLDTGEPAGWIPTALIPSDMETDSTRGRVYAALPAAGALVYLDAELQPHHLLDMLSPSDIALDTIRGKLYVSSQASRSLAIVDPDVVSAEFVPLDNTAPSAPIAVAVDPAQDRVYAGTRVLQGATAQVITALQITPLSAWPMPTAPVETWVDPIQQRAFLVAFNGVPGSNGGMIIYILDLRTGEQLPGYLGGTSTTSVWLDVEGRRLYSTAVHFTNYRLYVDDLDSLTHLAERPLEAMPVDIAYIPATHHLFIAGEIPAVWQERPAQGELLVLDARTLGEVTRIMLPEPPARITADAAAQRVYAAVGIEGKVLVIQDAPAPAPPAPTASPTPSPWPTPTAPPAAPAGSPQEVPSPTPTTCARAVSPVLSPFDTSPLGCPSDAEQTTDMAEQPFQYGLMFWRGDVRQIYVLWIEGGYTAVADAWTGPPEYACQAEPPAGLVQPKRGFGLVWCTDPAVRGRLGWGLEAERGYRAVLQPFERGLAWHNDRGQAFAVLFDGTWQVLRPKP